MALDSSTQRETPSLSPEEEIRELEQKLEEKKRQLAGEVPAAPEEKEIFREVLREHIEEVRARESAPGVSQPSAGGGLPSDTAQKNGDAQQTQATREGEVRALIEIALGRSIEQAVRSAEAMTPYLLDELHDHLVDDYYDKLVALRKLKQF